MNLSAGTYDLDIDIADEDYADIDTTATLATNETGELEIVAEQKADQSTVSYRIVDENNSDVKDATVVVFNEDGTIKDVLSIGEDAVTPELELLDGEYTMAVYKNGYAVETVDVSVDGEDVTIPVIKLSAIK